jgi:hypothetical protein
VKAEEIASWRARRGCGREAFVQPLDLDGKLRAAFLDGRLLENGCGWNLPIRGRRAGEPRDECRANDHDRRRSPEIHGQLRKS